MSTVRHSIGDKVVALTNPKDQYCQPRLKGTVYTVLDYKYCSKCGTQAINIGEITTSEYAECSCGSISISNCKCWTDSMHFANIKNIESELLEAIKNEDYEFASILRDTKII